MKGFLSPSHRVQTGSGTLPETGPLFAGLISAEVKNEWSYTSTPHMSSWRGA
jgi:hypothetical protein